MRVIERCHASSSSMLVPPELRAITSRNRKSQRFTPGWLGAGSVSGPRSCFRRSLTTRSGESSFRWIKEPHRSSDSTILSGSVVRWSTSRSTPEPSEERLRSGRKLVEADIRRRTRRRLMAMSSWRLRLSNTSETVTDSSLRPGMSPTSLGSSATGHNPGNPSRRKPLGSTPSRYRQLLPILNQSLPWEGGRDRPPWAAGGVRLWSHRWIRPRLRRLPRVASGPGGGWPGKSRR